MPSTKTTTLLTKEIPVTQTKCFKVDLAINATINSSTFRILPVTQLLLNTGEQQQGAIRAKRQELTEVCLLPCTEEFVGNEDFNALRKQGGGGSGGAVAEGGWWQNPYLNPCWFSQICTRI